MSSVDCKMERISNVSIGVILLFIGLIFALLGISVFPVIGLLIAVPVVILGIIFVLAPRSRACTLLVRKVRDAAKS